MSTTLHYVRCATKKYNGEVVEGAFFSGREYGGSRECHKFFSYKEIVTNLKSRPKAAQDPCAFWDFYKENQKGEDFVYARTLTREFTFALDAHVKQLCQKFDKAVRMGEPMVFDEVILAPENGKPIALFEIGQGCEARYYEQIRPLLGMASYESLFDIDELLKTKLTKGKTYYPDGELIEALCHFQKFESGQQTITVDQNSVTGSFPKP